MPVAAQRLYRRGVASADAGGGATATCPVPAGVADGDVMVAAVVAGNQSAAVTPPAGWTLLADMQSNVGAGQRLLAYTRTAASEPGSYQWTTSHAADGLCVAIVAYYDTMRATPRVESVATADDPSGADNLTTASRLPPVNYAAVLGVFGQDQNAAPAYTLIAPASATKIVEETETANNVALVVTEEIQTEAAQTSHAIAETGGGDAARGAATMLIVLAPSIWREHTWVDGEIPTAAALNDVSAALALAGPAQRQIELDPLIPPHYQRGWSRAVAQFGPGSAPYGGYRISQGAQGAYIGWDVYLRAGQYLPALVHDRNTDRGIYSLRLDGQEVATFDGWASSQAWAWDVGTEISVATSRLYRVELVMAARHASSSGYVGKIAHCGLLCVDTTQPWSPTRSFVDGEIESSAQWRRHVRDALEAVGAHQPHIILDTLQPASETATWPTLVTGVPAHLNAYRQSNGNQYASLTWHVPLVPGVYRFGVRYQRGGDCGRFALYVDGVRQPADAGPLEEIESYGGTGVNDRGWYTEFQPFVVAKCARVALTLRMESKDPASTGYYGRVSRAYLYRARLFGEVHEQLEGPGTVVAGIGLNQQVLTKYSLLEDAQIDALYAILDTGAGSGPVKALIYAADGAGGIPGTLMAVSQEVTVSGGARWYECLLASPVSLPAGDYWLGVHCGSNNPRIAYRTQTGAGMAKADSYADGPLSPYGAAGTVTNRRYIVYATYQGQPVYDWVDPQRDWPVLSAGARYLVRAADLNTGIRDQLRARGPAADVIGIDPMLAPKRQTGWDVRTQNSQHDSYPYCQAFTTTSDLRGGYEIVWDVSLTAGSWIVDVICQVGPTKGILDVYVGDTLAGSMDNYAAANAWQLKSTSPVAIAAPAVYELRMVSQNRNVLATAYHQLVHRIGLRRV